MKKIISFYPLVLVGMAALAPLHGADNNKTWTDAETASKEDRDFSIQGEYEAKGVGAQVIALGDGHFQAVLYPGGLPGAGWDGKGKSLMDGKLDGAKAAFVPAAGDKKYMAGGGTAFSATSKFPPEGHRPYSGEISGGKFMVKAEGGESVTLKRTVRQSPSLGARPPAGAVVLFDGRDAKQWKNGKVENGLLAGSNALSLQTFKDCTIHIEFQTPYKPHARSQGRGNSGVYYMGRWETQVLDSFGLEGLNNECGGIYSIAKPSVNMCLPPLSWQSYDVDYTAAGFDKDGKRTSWPRIRVKLNGVLIHEDLELGKTHTTAAPVSGEIKDEGGPIFLQDHGNPVFYRNIWVVPKK